jgi:cysteinyl-tRNA synthetase
MSTAHLGETIDVHVGGRDLVFPHHENEIAQSEGATGEQFVRHWLHQGMLEVDDEKMSSSERNFTTVADALEEYGPDVLRTFLLGAAYGSRLTLSSETVAEAEDRFDRLERAHDRATAAADSVDAYATVTDPALQEAVDDARERFPAAMDDDLNTREALSVLSELASSVLAHDEAGPPYDYRGLKRAIDALEEFGGDVLGLSLGAPAGGAVGLADDLVETLLSVRERHREAGDYEAADRIRDRLQAVGVEVEDADDGPRYRLP